MRIELNQMVTGADLARLLEENEGTFLCQQSGTTYIATAQRGHSITSLRQYGRKFVEVPSQNSGPELWSVQKLSNQSISTEGLDYERSQREPVR